MLLAAPSCGLGRYLRLGPGLCSLSFLLQDAPLSDCTETIEGLELTEQTFSPAKSLSFRKVLAALPSTTCRHVLPPTCPPRTVRPAGAAVVTGTGLRVTCETARRALFCRLHSSFHVPYGRTFQFSAFPVVAQR